MIRKLVAIVSLSTALLPAAANAAGAAMPAAVRSELQPKGGFMAKIPANYKPVDVKNLPAKVAAHVNGLGADAVKVYQRAGSKPFFVVDAQNDAAPNGETTRIVLNLDGQALK